MAVLVTLVMAGSPTASVRTPPGTAPSSAPAGSPSGDGDRLTKLVRHAAGGYCPRSQAGEFATTRKGTVLICRGTPNRNGKVTSYRWRKAIPSIEEAPVPTTEPTNPPGTEPAVPGAASGADTSLSN